LVQNFLLFRADFFHRHQSAETSSLVNVFRHRHFRNLNIDDVPLIYLRCSIPLSCTLSVCSGSVLKRGNLLLRLLWKHHHVVQCFFQIIF
jgi:hypothetical protein